MQHVYIVRSKANGNIIGVFDDGDKIFPTAVNTWQNTKAVVVHTADGFKVVYGDDEHHYVVEKHPVLQRPDHF